MWRWVEVQRAGSVISSEKRWDGWGRDVVEAVSQATGYNELRMVQMRVNVGLSLQSRWIKQVQHPSDSRERWSRGR